MRGLDEDVRLAASLHGIRNRLLTSVAPTGTISLVADNVSSGIEPVFAHGYTREVTGHAVQLDRTVFGAAATLPAHFVTTRELPPAAHARMQAAVQRHMDSAISKTVSIPEETPARDMSDYSGQRGTRRGFLGAHPS